MRALIAALIPGIGMSDGARAARRGPIAPDRRLASAVSARRVLIARRARGMSLVEVLVALVVLSIGMLGVAVMFVQSVRSSRSALLRTQAVNLVSDMAERIRANASAGEAYDLGRWGGAPALHDCAPAAGAGGGSNCTVLQLAEDDLARWQAAVRESLPGSGAGPADSEVEFFAAAGGPERYRIAVRWQEPDEQQPFSYETDVILMPRMPMLAAVR